MGDKHVSWHLLLGFPTIKSLATQHSRFCPVRALVEESWYFSSSIGLGATSGGASRTAFVRLVYAQLCIGPGLLPSAHLPCCNFLNARVTCGGCLFPASAALTARPRVATTSSSLCGCSTLSPAMVGILPS